MMIIWGFPAATTCWKLCPWLHVRSDPSPWMTLPSVGGSGSENRGTRTKWNQWFNYHPFQNVILGLYFWANSGNSNLRSIEWPSRMCNWRQLRHQSNSQTDTLLVVLVSCFFLKEDRVEDSSWSMGAWLNVASQILSFWVSGQSTMTSLDGQYSMVLSGWSTSQGLFDAFSCDPDKRIFCCSCFCLP